MKNQQRNPAYVSDEAKQAGIMCTCNSCDRIIWEDENWTNEYKHNGGYCRECAEGTEDV